MSEDLDKLSAQADANKAAAAADKAAKDAAVAAKEKEAEEMASADAAAALDYGKKKAFGKDTGVKSQDEIDAEAPAALNIDAIPKEKEPETAEEKAIAAK